MVVAARLASLALILAGTAACTGLHGLAEYYALDDTGDTSGDTGDSGDTDSGDTDTDTGPIDTDTGPVDTGGTTLCTDTCIYALDGECDDGGPGSDWSICTLGTDCGDCGPRTVSGGCDDSCFYAGDGWCDDGGPNSETDWCTYATDCTDCGPR